jgi:hypothetical protein
MYCSSILGNKEAQRVNRSFDLCDFDQLQLQLPGTIYETRGSFGSLNVTPTNTNGKMKPFLVNTLCCESNLELNISIKLFSHQECKNRIKNPGIGQQ